MAEAAVGVAIDVLLQKLISVSAEEIRLVKNFGKDLQKLKESAAMIQDLLEDAETKVVTNKQVTRWLRKLEGVAFDADYLFDEINYQLLRKEVQRGSKMKKKVRCFFPNFSSIAFRRRMALKIKDVEGQLKSINDEATTRLDLQRRIEGAPAFGAGTEASTSRETDSFAKDPIFIGRDNDARKIVEMVINSPTKEVLSVIPIVGMGGLGKTTLARKVFHDSSIISHFENRIWVYVSENFFPETIFKNIFLSLTGKNVDGNREVVLRELQEKLEKKKYLLVLDDVWNEDRDKWDNFITSLEAISPAKENVILVTTRKGNTASMAKTNYAHELGVLSEQECWSIIKAKAFGKDSISSKFESIGASIARKCGGLPLAAKVVGSFLRGKFENEWWSIEKKWFSDFGGNENTISKILRLSFDNLPSPSVKKCFAYCSILPKGRLIKKDEMIHLWMAERLLQSHQERDMENVGNIVLNALLGSSLLQVHERDQHGFSMHDLVHDLASSILNPRLDEGAQQVRYISKPLKDELSPISEEHAKHLRALFFSDKISPSMISNLTRLHVLILNDGEMKELPIEIGKLICLRLLDISNTGLECLPDSIGNLFHLQTLRATVEYGGEGCLRKLPHTIKFLAVNLRHLYIPNIELPPEIGKLTSLQTLPFYRVSGEEGCGIMELGSLVNLKGEISIHNLEKVRNKEEAQKASLFQKEDVLKIKLVWNESREDDASNDEKVLEGLQPHRNLESLDIQGFKGNSFPLWTLKMEVREDRWIRLDNLIEIKLSSCTECKEIPMMGHLPLLKYLFLHHLKNVECIGSSFYGIKGDDVSKESMIVLFPALEKLELIGMRNLSTWTEVELSSSFGTKVSVFRHLEYLKIEDCRELKSAPSHFSCLKELEINGMRSGLPLATICQPTLTTLRKLTIEDVDGMMCLPDGLFNNNRDLLELKISHCHNLMHLVPCLGGGGASLRSLFIYNCQSFDRLPEDVHELNALEHLRVSYCPNLKTISYPSGGKLSSIQGFTSLREMEFHRCTGLTNFPLEMVELYAPSLEKLDLYNSENIRNIGQVLSTLHKTRHLKELRIHGVPILSDAVVEFGSIRNLEWLCIGGSGDMDCLNRIFPAFACVGSLRLVGKDEWDGLPDQLQHLTTLHELFLCDFGIQVLPEWLERLSSLRSLILWNCRKLRHLPSKKAMQGLTRLNEIDIGLCPLLKQNLEEGSDDSEWSKISHIPNIKVDGDPFSRPC